MPDAYDDPDRQGAAARTARRLGSTWRRRRMLCGGRRILPADVYTGWRWRGCVPGRGGTALWLLIGLLVGLLIGGRCRPDEVQLESASLCYWRFRGGGGRVRQRS